MYLDHLEVDAYGTYAGVGIDLRLLVLTISALREEVPPLLAPSAELVLPSHDRLPYDVEPWFVGAEGEHD